MPDAGGPRPRGSLDGNRPLGIAPGQVSALLAKARSEKLVVKEGAGYALKK